MDGKKLEFSGKKLAEARQAANVTQKDLAGLVGKDPRYVSNYERGAAKPPADDLLTYMNFLNLVPTDLAK